MTVTGRSVVHDDARAATAAKMPMAAVGLCSRPASTAASASSSGTQTGTIPASSSVRVKRSAPGTAVSPRARNTTIFSDEPPGLV